MFSGEKSLQLVILCMLKTRVILQLLFTTQQNVMVALAHLDWCRVHLEFVCGLT